MHTTRARMCFQSQPDNTPSIQLHSTTFNTATRPSTSVGAQHTTLTGHVSAWLPHHQTAALSKRVSCSITPPPLPRHTHFGSAGGLIPSLHAPAAQLTVRTELVSSSSYDDLPCFITLLLLPTARPPPLAADAAGAVPVLPLPPRPALLLDAGCCGCNQRSQLPCCWPVVHTHSASSKAVRAGRSPAVSA